MLHFELNTFFDAVAKMRSEQRNYFRYHHNDYLQRALIQERRVDQMIENLTKEGLYRPMPEPKQLSIFGESTTSDK